MPRRPRKQPPAADPFDPFSGPVDETIDLHGFTAMEARARVSSALERARRAKPGCLLHIITGRGKNSAGKPVLKGLVRGMLAKGGLSQVAAWSQDDGEGGFLVRVKGGRWGLGG